MAYKKYYETFSRSNSECKINTKVFSQRTQYGFRHVCTSICFEFINYRTIIDLPNINVICRYYNRTYECFRFQSVLIKVAKKYLDDELFKIAKELL